MGDPDVYQTLCQLDLGGCDHHVARRPVVFDRPPLSRGGRSLEDAQNGAGRMIRVLVLWLAMATAAFAVQPDEILDDPVLEERARELSKGIRCLVCRNESIDESNAELARDLRLLVRERLVEGDSDDQVIDFLVSRYGEYVLLTPRATGANLVLWLAPVILFAIALAIALVYVRGRRDPVTDDGLSEAEKARLAKLMEE